MQMNFVNTHARTTITRHTYKTRDNKKCQFFVAFSATTKSQTASRVQQFVAHTPNEKRVSGKNFGKQH